MLKIPLWLLILILIFLIIFSVIYGSLIVQHYEYGARYPRLEKVIIKISKYPIEIRQKLLFGGGLPDNSK